MTAEGAKHRSESGRIAVGEAAVDADARICPKNPTPTRAKRKRIVCHDCSVPARSITFPIGKDTINE